MDVIGEHSLRQYERSRASRSVAYGIGNDWNRSGRDDWFVPIRVPAQMKEQTAGLVLSSRAHEIPSRVVSPAAMPRGYNPIFLHRINRSSTA